MINSDTPEDASLYERFDAVCQSWHNGDITSGQFEGMIEDVFTAALAQNARYREALEEINSDFWLSPKNEKPGASNRMREKLVAALSDSPAPSDPLPAPECEPPLNVKFAMMKVASCTCQTKTNESQFHNPECKYRILCEVEAELAKVESGRRTKDEGPHALQFWQGRIGQRDGWWYRDCTLDGTWKPIVEDSVPELSRLREENQRLREGRQEIVTLFARILRLLLPDESCSTVVEMLRIALLARTGKEEK